MSFWSKLGGKIEHVFGFISSPTGQALPGLTGIINLINKWVSKAATVEALAVAASQADGTGSQKAALVLQDIVPVALADLTVAGLPAPDAATLALVNTKIVEILNLLSGEKTTPVSV